MESLTSQQLAQLRAAFKKHAQPCDDDGNDNNNRGNDSDGDNGEGELLNDGQPREKGVLDRDAFRAAVADVDFSECCDDNNDDGEGGGGGGGNGAELDQEAADALFDEVADWESGEGRVSFDSFAEVVASSLGIEEQEREILRQWQAVDDGSGSVKRADFISVLVALGEDVNALGLRGGGGDDNGSSMRGQEGSFDSNDSGSGVDGDRIQFADFAVMYGLSQNAISSFETGARLRKRQELAQRQRERSEARGAKAAALAMQHFLQIPEARLRALSREEACCLCLDPLCEPEQAQAAKSDAAVDKSASDTTTTAAAATAGEQPAATKPPLLGGVVVFPAACQHLMHRDCIAQVVQHDIAAASSSSSGSPTTKRSGSAGIIVCPMCNAQYNWRTNAVPAVAAAAVPAQPQPQQQQQQQPSSDAVVAAAVKK